MLAGGQRQGVFMNGKGSPKDTSFGITRKALLPSQHHPRPKFDHK